MIGNVDNTEKTEKTVSTSGICTNCKNEKICDFVKGIKIFIANKKCAEKIVDTELIVYSCDEYEDEKGILPDNGICISCKCEA